jgi:hypothetical protein
MDLEMDLFIYFFLFQKDAISLERHLAGRE